MEKEILEKYIKAGKIAASARDFARDLVKEGTRALDVAETTEAFIKKQGGGMAFPLNISVNDIAAHYTPITNDTLVFKAGDVVKIDIGVEVDGYIADTAFTVVVGPSPEKQKMVAAIEKALDIALKIIKPGINIGKIGAAIEKEITAAGFKSIRNLSGHLLERFDVHAGLTIPNIKVETDEVLEEGMVVAIEPFLTDGAGMVKDSDKGMIYLFLEERPVRMLEARKILKIAADDFKGLPFASRWVAGKFSPVILEAALRQCVAAGALHKYNVLREAASGTVAQAEHTVIVLEKPIVSTKSRLSNQSCS